jgi:hypothetical protein
MFGNNDFGGWFSRKTIKLCYVSFGNNVTFGTDWLCFFFSCYCRNPFFSPFVAEKLVFLGCGCGCRLRFAFGCWCQGSNRRRHNPRGEWIFPRFETTAP